jgi:glycosyltransferase involved in cell wall biosynthesis
MRIAYVTPYQGSTLLKQRPIVRNRSMSNRIKIELIASLLQNSHEVEIISQGEVVDNSWTFYPAFSEPERFHPQIPIYYGSALPIRRLNGLWSNRRTLQILTGRHRANPYDVVIVFNLQGPQVACANYAIRYLGLPVILEYEDDRFVNVQGETVNGFASRRDSRAAIQLLRSVSGCMAVSPHLLSQAPAEIPKLLLRGVVGADIVKAGEESRAAKKNIVLFSGTHIASNGVGQLIEAWRDVRLREWELHITGFGGLTDALRQKAAEVQGIVFHGLVSRPELVQLMCSAKICINPHQLSQTPGNVFAFKIIEYLAAGAHVITTPMGTLEKEVESGITYMPDNEPATIAATLNQVIRIQNWQRCAAEYVSNTYGPERVTQSLDVLLHQSVQARGNAADVRGGLAAAAR